MPQETEPVTIIDVVDTKEFTQEDASPAEGDAAAPVHPVDGEGAPAKEEQLQTPSADQKPVKKKKKKQQQAAAPEPTVVLPDNSYINLLNKRLRNYKKKLEKVKDIEAKQAQGKAINEQQREALSKKDDLLKLQTELEGLRTQMLDLQLEEYEAQKKTDVKTEAAPPTQEEPIKETAASESTQTEPLPELQAPSDAQPVEESAVDVKAAEDRAVERILCLLHTVGVQKELGKELPSPLDFFRRVLLGSTRPPEESSFLENLKESLAESRKYLNREQKEVAHGLTYAQLEDAVNEIVRAAEEKAASTSAVPAFNFFVDADRTLAEEALTPEAPVEVSPGAEGPSVDLQMEEQTLEDLPAAEMLPSATTPEPVVAEQTLEAAVEGGQEAEAQDDSRDFRYPRSHRGRARGHGARGGQRDGDSRDYRDRRGRGPRPPHAQQEGANPAGNRSDSWRRRGSGPDNRGPRGPRGGYNGQKFDRNGGYADKVSSGGNGPITTHSDAPVPAAH